MRDSPSEKTEVYLTEFIEDLFKPRTMQMVTDRSLDRTVSATNCEHSDSSLPARILRISIHTALSVLEPANFAFDRPF